MGFVATLGCGNNMSGTAGYYKMPASAMPNNGHYLTVPLTDEYTGPNGEKAKCPNETNINPDYDLYLDGSGAYKACTISGVVESVLVAGHPHNGTKICAFPVRIIDENHIYAQQDLKTNLPLYTCLTANDEGVTFTFAKLNYEGLFIVEQANVSSMQLCLGSGSYALCPAFAFGQFR